MKYSVGQKVKIRSLEWYRDNVNRYGIIECGKYEFFEPMNEYCGKVVTIKRIDDDNYRIDVDKGAFCWTDEMIEGLVEEEDLIPKFGDEPLDIPTMTTDFIKEYGLPCPNGYQFKDENGNVINAMKIVLEKKKPKYPNTPKECCEVLNTEETYLGIGGHKGKLLQNFQKLLICRDAYWKIAGEQMELDKPWEPDWKNGTEIKYTIVYSCSMILNGTINLENKILAFPTKEMRDAFYENFKDLIESCKTLL